MKPQGRDAVAEEVTEGRPIPAKPTLQIRPQRRVIGLRFFPAPQRCLRERFSLALFLAELLRPALSLCLRSGGVRPQLLEPMFRS
ncbi:MAG: hypothetical protein AAFR84_06540 [Pseudomonadota bacterium]